MSDFVLEANAFGVSDNRVHITSPKKLVVIFDTVVALTKFVELYL